MRMRRGKVHAPFACVRGREQAKRCERGMLHAIHPRKPESRGEGKSWQSFPNHGNHGSNACGISPFAHPCHSEALPCHSEAKRGIPPSRSVRGLGGCPIPSFRARYTSFTHKPESRGARVGIMAIIPTSWQSWFKRVRNPPFAQTMSFRERFTSFTRASRNPEGHVVEIMPIIPASRQSWFKPAALT